DFGKLKQAFIDFLHHLPFYGLAVLCGEDPVVRELLPQAHRAQLTYGFQSQFDIWASDVVQHQAKMSFNLHLP
ncbi:MAG: UDP-N-acetylmuramate--L-alanine ligase, partial [Xanthomonadales bacterium]|nr:UDP-N-acetylmuramate--L-alanine ligase [Xanthomonadales bacterium]